MTVVVGDENVGPIRAQALMAGNVLRPQYPARVQRQARGATAIAELLDMSDRIREMILQRRPGADIKRAAKEEGMIFLREAALAKVFAGRTTLHEINKVTFVD